MRPVWQADDGKIFITKEECAKYENQHSQEGTIDRISRELANTLTWSTGDAWGEYIRVDSYEVWLKLDKEEQISYVQALMNTAGINI